MNNTLALLGVILLVILLIIIGPMAVIWSLNTLFPVLAIPYTLWTWLATLILSATVAPSVRIKK